ncbi:hypothetical protein FH608_033895 [Nonomuraea phyllanthi]|uniref:Uncharacterized protein n=1 Tax=Nonomuraea phyllanthi TaxID=2219224 RepID=A0A5C4VXJ9_9ACTN|nr:hypothetical protein [Nonomuraea phyllanthi]KAB8190529.1 hypothetical protein FH608_033895 [Nonomuraea phyllanthi]
MTKVVPAERMPTAALAARVVVTLQVGMGLLFAATFLAGAVAVSGDPALLVEFIPGLLLVALLGWLIFRWRSRRKWVRWSAIAIEVVAVGMGVITAAVGGALDWGTLIRQVLPLAIIVLLLTPSAARWFDR